MSQLCNKEIVTLWFFEICKINLKTIPTKILSSYRQYITIILLHFYLVLFSKNRWHTIYVGIFAVTFCFSLFCNRIWIRKFMSWGNRISSILISHRIISLLRKLLRPFYQLTSLYSGSFLASEMVMKNFYPINF